MAVTSSVAGNKHQKMLASENGVITIELNDQENKTICLSEKIALRLATIGVDLEMLFGSARDIEWAVVNENIYLLQARPITTLYTWTDFELMHELDSCVPSDIDRLIFANVGEVFPYPISPLSISVVNRAFNSSIAAAFQSSDRIFFHIVTMKCCINYYNVSSIMNLIKKHTSKRLSLLSQMFLRNPSKTITLLNKVTDIAICGAVLITPETLKVACDRNGISSRLDRILILCDMVKDAIKNSTKEKTAQKIRQNLNLNAEDFHTAYSLYNEINQHKDEFLMVGIFRYLKIFSGLCNFTKLLGSRMSYAYIKS